MIARGVGDDGDRVAAGAGGAADSGCDRRAEHIDRVAAELRVVVDAQCLRVGEEERRAAVIVHGGAVDIDRGAPADGVNHSDGILASLAIEENLRNVLIRVSGRTVVGDAARGGAGRRYNEIVVAGGGHAGGDADDDQLIVGRGTGPAAVEIDGSIHDPIAFVNRDDVVAGVADDIDCAPIRVVRMGRNGHVRRRVDDVNESGICRIDANDDTPRGRACA